MHVHVQGQTGEAKIWLEPAVEIAHATAFSPHQSAEALRIVREHEDEIRTAWRQYFGG